MPSCIDFWTKEKDETGERRHSLLRNKIFCPSRERVSRMFGKIQCTTTTTMREGRKQEGKPWEQ